MRLYAPLAVDLGARLDALYKELMEVKKAFKTKEIDAIKKTIKEFEVQLKSEKIKYTYTQERFMSTTFVKENRFDKSKYIRFEFSVPQGTKGTFIGTYNDLNKNGTEVEYLLQRNTKVSIEEISWSDDFDCWYIKAVISQD